jgi:hypothetical protein
MLEPRSEVALETERLVSQCRRWRLLALVSVLGVVTLFFGLIAAILCQSALASAAQGDAVDARAKLRWGQALTLAGVSIAMLTAVAYLAAG